MNYAPQFKEARRARDYRLGTHAAVLLTDIVRDPEVGIEYEHVLIVFDVEAQQAVFVVASEKAALPSPDGSGSHVLGIFPGDGHENMGASSEWADLEAFATKALDVAAKRLGLAGTWENLTHLGTGY